MKHLSAVLVSALACGACAPTDSSLTESAGFHDGAWVLVVDRALRDGSGTTGLPEAPLSESDFAPAAGNTRYQVDVSEQGAQIVINATLAPETPGSGKGTTIVHLVGRLESATPDSWTYQIVAGSFAGGRFVASQISGGLQGELTTYGSGRPVLRSERGPLRQMR
jgi:hypothetical protein